MSSTRGCGNQIQGNKMRTKIIDLIRRGLGTKQIFDRLDRIERGLDATTRRSDASLLTESSLEILPGTEYSLYAIPLDYPPSRAFAPRYGYSRGKIEALEQWFASHNSDYLKFLEYMRTLSVGHIPISLSAGAPLAPAWIGGPICAFDSLALYAMVQKYTPKTYLEIGSGMTTCFARQAIMDAGLKTRIISIDPQPRREVDAICDEVIRDGLETCDLSAFDLLEAGDILFFDGSHRSFMNSDVTVFFIDVLPRIKPGVIVHIHDINLPWDYPDSFKYWYWNEQYMLAIYLMMGREQLNPIFPTTWVCRGMVLRTGELPNFIDLGSAEANLSWKGGGSMWFTKRTK
jgi:hypothetical protein